jgi:hypothetical protein
VVPEVVSKDDDGIVLWQYTPIHHLKASTWDEEALLFWSVVNDHHFANSVNVQIKGIEKHAALGRCTKEARSTPVTICQFMDEFITNNGNGITEENWCLRYRFLLKLRVAR